MSDAQLIVVGAGCSGLALGRTLCEYGSRAPRTLLLDQREHYTDDRSWSFWARPGDRWLPYARSSWSTWAISRLHGDSVIQRASRRRYACLRGLDYYQQQRRHIDRHPDVELRLATRIQAVRHQNGRFRIETDRGSLTADHVIDTRPEQKVDPVVWQQFVGHEIRTDAPCFDPGTAGLMLAMDCDRHGFVFTYLLPFSTDHALIESTRFCPRLLDTDVLDADTRRATERLTAGARAQILRREFGRLPMGYWPQGRRTSRDPARAGARGGALRSASGYGFLRMQAWAGACARSMIERGRPLAHPAEPAWRRAMDSRFLKVIRRDPDRASELFERMARGLSGERMARFLSDEARLTDILWMLAVLPKRPFIRPTFTDRSRRGSLDT